MRTNLLDPVRSDEPRPQHWFEDVADFLGPAYLRYSFTMGTAQECEFLVDALGLEPGMRVLDVGCGPGRHANELARRGLTVHGVDISGRFVELAIAESVGGATFERLDARELPFDDAFDAAYSLCQGAFGLAGGAGAPLDVDGEILAGMARALRPGGRLAVSAFSAYFQLRFLEEADSFDAEAGVNHELAPLRDGDGIETTADLWTTCFTPRELRLMAGAAGVIVDAIWSVTPGKYGRRPPSIDEPEFLLLAHR